VGSSLEEAPWAHKSGGGEKGDGGRALGWVNEVMMPVGVGGEAKGWMATLG
jgi:hypothetical protein